VESMPLARLLEKHECARLAWQVANDAGRFLRDERPDELEVFSKSTPTDVVTEMDRASEEIIVGCIVGARPNDGILGEEGSTRTGTSGVNWIVDPLDGTVNFLFGIPTWGVSVGVQVDGVGEVGVIATPVLGESYVGIRGSGAWRIRGDVAERINGRPTEELGQALVATGFGYAPDRRLAQVAVLEGVIAHVRDIRRTGCATVDFTWLASGRIDAYYERGIHPWDYAAGLVIVEEAGARTWTTSSPESGTTVVCAMPSIFDELLEKLQALGVERGP
jgi:myo-inositol-1(or 4)-monophosphatase